MKTTSILCLGFGILLSAAAVLPAAAATKPASQTASTSSTAKQHHVHYYVSRKPHGTGCEIVNHRPASKMMVGKYYYGTHKNAVSAMKANNVCHA